jgi:hypothetical protein
MTTSRQVDKELAMLLVMNTDLVTKHQGVFEAFFKKVREQALADSADYLTRMGTEVHNKMREKAPGAAKEVRQLLYSCAHQIRSNGEVADKVVDQMIQAMKGEQSQGPTVQGLLKDLREGKS